MKLIITSRGKNYGETIRGVGNELNRGIRMVEDTDKTDDRNSGVNRRPFIKASGAAVTGLGLAGCSGNGGGNGGDDVGTVAGDKNFEGLTFEYWNQMNVQSRAAREVSEKLVNRFQDNTGASIEVNWSGYSNVIGATWRNNFSKGNYPVVYDSVTTWDGQFVDGDWIVPFEEYSDQFDDETLSAIEWMMPVLEEQYSGFDRTVYHLPYGYLLQIPFVARMDHFDEAGLSRDRFPPKDYDDLIDIATTLQEDGPGEFGYQIHGTKFDVTDCRLPNLAAAAGGKEGLFLNEDWSDTHWDNDVWKTAVKQWVDIYTEHGLSNPGTPDHDDEAMVQEIASGTTSMNSGDFLNHPDMMDQIPDLMENGDVQWGHQWAGSGNSMGLIQPYGMAICRPPEDADEAKWEEKQQAGVEFMKLFLDKDFQLSLFENFGLFPVREDVWSELPTAEHKLYRTATTMAENSELAWNAHPKTASVQYNIPAPHIQEALNGNKSPEQACDDIAQEVRDQLL